MIAEIVKKSKHFFRFFTENFKKIIAIGSWGRYNSFKSGSEVRKWKIFIRSL